MRLLVGFVEAVDHWIAFILLLIIGYNMIKESREDDLEKSNDKFDFKTMMALAIATSIDALAVGITFSFFKTNIIFAISIIGIITFILSIIGFCVGEKFGDRFKTKAELAGGLVLILIGLKILLEHLGLI